jgi:heme-degrading monooxygenase HmoA
MSQMIVLLRSLVPPAEQHRLQDQRNRLLECFVQSAGFRSTTLWQSVKDERTYLSVSHFDSPATAEEGFVRAQEQGIVTSRVFGDAPEIRRVVLAAHHGTLPNRVEAGQFMSLGIKEADPGFGPDLLEELHDIFEELSVLDGYLGSMRGKNEVIDDEVIGFVFWRDLEAFHKSVSPNALRRIELYRRLL